jgi:DNA invertase Pin-like site-specific DNA recombinase
VPDPSQHAPAGDPSVRHGFAPAPMPAIGYASAAGSAVRVAAEMNAQRAAIERRCALGDLELVELVGDRETKESPALGRTGLTHALQRMADGDALCLVVAGLGQLGRSIAELGELLRWLDDLGGRLVVLDLGVDTATEAGRATATALASVGEWERERLSERTRAGLQAARAKRRADAAGTGEHTEALRRRIAAMRTDGMTLQGIADTLNAEGVPTLRGGATWRPSSVQGAVGYTRPSRITGRLPDTPSRP